MRHASLSELSCERAAALLRDLAPRGTGFHLCHTSGDVVWSSETSHEPEFVRAWSELGALAADGESVETSLIERPVGARAVLLASALLGNDGAPLAWLCATVEDRETSAELKRLAETLPRVAAFLEQEHRLGAELSSAVSELADRYEELNLVFNVERQSSLMGQNSSALQAMLASFTRHLQVDVALFMAPEYGQPIHALGGRRKIKNLDLVLVELRGRLWRFLAASKKLFVLNDRDDPRRAYLLTHLPFKAIGVPSADCGALSGGLLLIRHVDEPDFSSSDVSLARVFVGQAMIMLRNQALMERMQRFTREMASSLVEAVEAKDPYTRGHSERVELITAGIGRRTALQERELEDLLWGALLHDIGKIGIPDSILLKPGRLTEDEYVFIKTHPERSYDILRHIRQLGDTALAGARYHQERFDGGGYPFGLQGSEIPLAARIVSVADTYDAITSSRSYRAASTHEDAMEIVRDAAGSQLDPDLVQVFCELVERDEEWLRAIRPHHAGGND